MILTMTSDQSWDWILHIETWSTVLRFSEGINRPNIKPSQFSTEMSFCKVCESLENLSWEYTNLWNQIHRKEFYKHSDSEKFSFLYIQERRQAVWLKSNPPLAPSLSDGRGHQIINELLEGLILINQTERT